MNSDKEGRRPRLGGGLPSYSIPFVCAGLAAPPRRGFALKTPRYHVASRPAPAGVCPEDGQRPHHGQRPPRADGGLPSIPVLPRVRESAAPPVRGSAPGTAATQDGHTDRPAWTGDRRIRRSLAGQWNRPLRTGGDPPTSSGTRCPNRSAAPHRRGSAPAGRRAHAGRRLPARAGIRPLPGRYSGQSPGQPRPAGISQRPGTNGAGRQHLPRRDGGTEQTPGP